MTSWQLEVTDSCPFCGGRHYYFCQVPQGQVPDASDRYVFSGPRSGQRGTMPWYRAVKRASSEAAAGWVLVTRLRGVTMTVDDVGQFWVVEYSKRQRAFHVEQLAEMIVGNVRHLLPPPDFAELAASADRDFVVVAIAPTYDDATAQRMKLEAMRDGGASAG